MNAVFVPAAISVGLIVFIVAVVIAIGIMAALYFYGKKLQKRQDEQKAMMASMAQKVSLMVVDKKRMRIKDATSLPKQVLEQTPWYLKRSKIPVVKVKIGPKVMTMMCEDSIFDKIPLKQELKATISGIYITDVKAVRGSLLVPEKKKSLWQRITKK